MDELFFKVWSKIEIRNHIFSFNNKSRNSLLSFISNQRFKCLLEKLKRNEIIEVEKEGLNQLLITSSNNIHFNEILELLWVQNKEEIKLLDPLKMILFQIDSVDLFKKIYSYISNDNSSSSNNISNNNSNNNNNNNSNNNNNNNNNNNKIIINQYYKLYDLLDLYFKSENKSLNNNTIPEYIINEIKNNSINQLLNYKPLINNHSNSKSSCSNNKKIKIEIDNESNKNIKALLNSIYSCNQDNDGATCGNDTGNEIPLFLGYNIQDIATNSTKEKLQLFNNNFGLDMVEQIRKYYSGSGFVNSKGKESILVVPSNNENNEDCINFYLKLILYGGVKVLLAGNEIDLVNMDYCKLYLLSRISNDSSIDIERFKLNLIKYNSKLVNIESLVNNVKSFKLSTTGNEPDQEDLIYYFGVYIIYYYLKIKDYKQVESYLNQSYQFKKYKSNIKYQSFNYNQIKSLSISFIFYYSILNLSIPLFELYSKYHHHHYQLINKDQQLKVLNKENYSETDKSKVKSFYKQLLSNETYKSKLSSSSWMQIIKIQMFNYGSSIFWFLLNQFKDIQTNYINLIKYDKWGMFYQHFKWAELGRLPDYKCIGIYNHFIKQIPSNECLEKEIQKDCPFSFNKIKNYYGMFLSSTYDLCLGNLNYSNFIIQNLVKLHKDAENKSINQSIIIFKFLNERLLYNYYSTDSNTLQYFINKSSILINNLMKSIIKKDIQSINKILSVVYNKSMDLSVELVELNSCFEVLYYLITNKYLKGFPLKLVLDWVINNMEPSYQFIFDCIPSDETNLREYYKQLFASPSIIIKYYSEDVMYDEEDQDDEDDELSQYSDYYRIGSGKQLYSLLYNKNYYQVLKYLNVNGTNSTQDLDSFDKLKLCSIKIPIQWFKRLYEPLLKSLLENEKSICEALVCNDLEVFDYIWDQHLSTAQDRIKIVYELLRDRSIELKFNKKKQKSILNIVLVLLKEKKSFFKLYSNQFNTSIKSQILEFLIINAQTKLFTHYHNLFNIDFKIGQDLFITSLKFNYGSRACYLIEYLFKNNYISNLKVLLDNNIPKDISKSTFILIHSILKYQDLKQHFDQQIKIQQQQQHLDQQQPIQIQIE